jgi:subfamily B ATP-binding cassette protein MsbA
MYGPVKKLSRVNASLQQAVAASERIFELLDTHSEVKERPGATPLPPFTRDIAFTNVGFGYADGQGRKALGGLTLDVRAGQMVAIVGRSGAGKTTLVNLLPRFYDVTDGRITIDGHDIRDVTLASLRAQIGIVTQETVLFDDTIANNIAYGRPHATRKEIEVAAKAAHAHEFIGNFPDGYDTRVGERGTALSGGERQRVAIARALVKNAPIILLDEATAALDSESELQVREAMDRLCQGRTTLAIAHRLHTVAHADRIYVIENGRAGESGRHDDLLRQNGRYASFYRLQLQEQEPRTPVAALARS